MKRTMAWQRIWVFFGGIVAIFALGWGGYQIRQSSLFSVKVVEVSELPENAPVDSVGILALAAVPIHQSHLFSLDLGAVERRLLAHPWIRTATITKRLPHTISIAVEFRRPIAFVQRDDGRLAYLDETGRIFGEVHLERQGDLPIVSGVSATTSLVDLRMPRVLNILRGWSARRLNESTELSQIVFDPERGWRLMITYPVSGRIARTLVELGPDPDADLDLAFDHLRDVLGYLMERGIEAHQVMADLGKKIVVKIAHRS